MGILESWATYWWNWVTFLDGYQTLMICWLVGGWGLFFSDDDGVLANRCYRMAGGKILAVNEFVEAAIETYKENYPNTPVLPDDIKKLKENCTKLEGILKENNMELPANTCNSIDNEGFKILGK